MEKETIEKTNKRKFLGWGSYITAGLIFASASSIYLKSTTSGLAITIVAIGILFLYYPLKSKLKFKNEKLKSFTSFVILYILSAFLIPILIVIINLIILSIGGSSTLELFNSVKQEGVHSYSWSDNCQNICILGSESKTWSINPTNLNNAKHFFKEYGGLFKPASNSDTGFSQLGAKYFSIQEQCIDYCLTQLK